MLAESRGGGDRGRGRGSHSNPMPGLEKMFLEALYGETSLMKMKRTNITRMELFLLCWILKIFP